MSVEYRPLTDNYALEPLVIQIVFRALNILF